ncbi:MAG: hypothetical protein PSN04_04115 [Methyloprofundus sp.]|nr:hypothetical protein [Methyloprofundus sp.]
MEINTNSFVAAASNHESSISKTSKEANQEKPNAAQDKAPSSPSIEDVTISKAGAQLSARAEASEESNAENNSENNNEANKAAEATRTQNSQSTSETLSTEERISKLKQAAQETPGAFYGSQANASESTVLEALYS